MTTHNGVLALLAFHILVDDRDGLLEFSAENGLSGTQRGTLNVMQVTLGSKGDYSVRSVLDLSRSYGHGRRKAREIAAAMDIPQKYVAQVLADLIRVGLVASTAGPGGGYELTRSPEEITLLEVVEAAEGEIRNPSCILRGGPCHWDIACAVHGAWSSAQDAFRERLRATTFADLAAADEELERRTASPA